MNEHKTSPAGRCARTGVLAALVALALAAALTLDVSGSSTARAQAATASLGVDVQPVKNTATSVAGVQNCLEAAVGDQFAIDIFARDLQKLVAWELRFAFDHQVVQIVDHKYDMFLTSTAPAGSIFPSLFDQETSGRYFLAAAELGGAPDTGSGILARITLEAIGPGRSQARIVAEPEYMAPYLTTSAGASLFSGPLSAGEIAVGQPCSGPGVKPLIPGPEAGTGSTTPPGSDSPLPNEEGDGDNPGSNPDSGDGSSDRVQGRRDTPAVAGVAQPPDDAPGLVADFPSGQDDPFEIPWWLVLPVLGGVLIAGTSSVFVFILRNRP